MMKYISSIILCALFISPVFLYFSKNYFLLIGIILENWVAFNLLTRYLENSYIKKKQIQLLFKKTLSTVG